MWSRPQAFQSIHPARAKSGYIDWQEIALLYEGLVKFAPNIGASVVRAVALAQAGNPSAGLNALDAQTQRRPLSTILGRALIVSKRVAGCDEEQRSP